MTVSIVLAATPLYSHITRWVLDHVLDTLILGSWTLQTLGILLHGNVAACVRGTGLTDGGQDVCLRRAVRLDPVLGQRTHGPRQREYVCSSFT